MVNNNMASLCNLSLLLLSLLSLPTTSIALLKHDIGTDKSALLALKSKMLDPSGALSDWNLSTRIPVCNWTGVICSARHVRVVSLDLSNAGLKGSISPQIGNLSFLTYIDCEGNSLQGELPEEMKHLRRLRFINLDNNSFSGDVPSWLGSLPNLEIISFVNNSFTGAIPVSLFNASKLGYLSIPFNQLHGNLPTEIGKNGMLKFLELEGNQISGSIPQSILNLTSLDLTQNNISGNLPPHITNNQLQNLEELYLGVNRLSGVIPDYISHLTKLTTLDLDENQFTGSVPPSLGNLTFLTYLNLNLNHLTVGSPPELSFLTSLPNCTKLGRLYISGNPIKGRLPSTIGQFSTRLRVFRAANFCKLEGNIPGEIGNVSRLLDMDLGENWNLNGPFPMEFENLRNLQYLDLSGNQISGPIPKCFCNFKQFDFFNLGENQLIGQLPECFGNMSSLTSLYLYSNKLNSTLPSSIGRMSRLLDFDVDSISLRGDIPQEIGNMKAAIYIDLSKNKFSGFIPTSIGGLENLINLSLSHNQLQGSIPETLSNMLNLQLFDLSHNNLTGHIPKSLASLQQLQYFNVSFNQLGGKIPSNGSFMNFTYESFMSNGGFCGGPPQLRFPHCPSNSTQSSGAKRLRLLTRILIPASVAIFVVVCCVIICVYKKTKRKGIEGQTDDRISFYDLRRATNSFDESNLISSGSYGSVYKGVLSDGTSIATKVFNLEVEGSFKSFDSECEVLRNVRHRNLIKVITSCSNLDFKALVLEYMPNVSLEKWLYSHNYFLDFSKRLNIVIDVASALVYLHRGYSSTIVHCDLKPANVLLDEDMTGRVCDFGIAKLFAGDESMAQTKTLATIGYIVPEYGFEGKVSTSCDVYNFGILLMETFSRKKPTDEMFSEDWGLRDWVGDSLEKSSTDFIDQNLMNTRDRSLEKLVLCVSDIMELALNCTVESMKDRTDMEFALAKLEKVRYHSTQRN